MAGVDVKGLGGTYGGPPYQCRKTTVVCCPSRVFKKSTSYLDYKESRLDISTNHKWKHSFSSDRPKNQWSKEREGRHSKSWKFSAGQESENPHIRGRTERNQRYGNRHTPQITSDGSSSTLSKSRSNPHNSQTQITNPKPRQTSSVQRPSSKPAIKNPILPSRPSESTDPDKQIAAQTPITHTDRYKTQTSNPSNPKNQARHDHRSPSP